MYVVPDLRQTDNTNDRYNSNSANGTYKYQRLGNASISNSEGSLNLSETVELAFPYQNTFLGSDTGCSSRLVKCTSDQTIPENFERNSLLYVNKNGLVSQLPPPSNSSERKCNGGPIKFVPKNNEIVCNAFLVELAKSSSSGGGYSRRTQDDFQSLKDIEGGRSVPTLGSDLNKSGNDSSINNSLGKF